MRRTGGLHRWAGVKALVEGQEEWGVDATEMLELIAYGGLAIGDSEGHVSMDDVEKLLEFQVEQMQSQPSFHFALDKTKFLVIELGNRIPAEVKDKFKKALDESIMIPSLSHYLK